MIDNFDFHEIVEILRNSVYITGLVIIMMLVIEYINVATRGRKFANIRKSPVKQVLLGAALGVIPGCMGGFVAVSLFSHNIFGFGGLVAAMISDTGDETFIMLAAIPEYALILKALTFILAISTGLIINRFFLKKTKIHTDFDHDLEIHEHDHEHSHDRKHANILHNLKHISLYRIIVLSGILLFMFGLGFGLLEHDHSAHELNVETEHALIHEHDHEHSHDCVHKHENCHEHHGHGHEFHAHSNIFKERWINLIFLIVASAALIMVLSVGEHFLKEHIFKHIIRKHLSRVFLWTFGSLLFIYLLGLFVRYDQWIDENHLLMLLIAISIGLIPESGPHIVFISLFIEGSIPFSILLANSLVQNGHSGLPLLAESKKGFVKTKLVALLVGLIVGAAGYCFGW